jgi:hypothetical protein
MSDLWHHNIKTKKRSLNLMTAGAQTFPVHHACGTGNGGSVEDYRFGSKKSIDGIVNQSCSGYQKQIGICKNSSKA